MNLIKLWDIEGNEINLGDYGLRGLSLIPESPSYYEEVETVAGMDGALSLGKQLNPRNLEARFMATANDYEDSLMLRDEIYSLFNSRESFYIGETRQPGKNWFVQSTEVWIPQRLNLVTYEVVVNLVCLSGRSESVYSTLTPFEWDVDAWQFGMGIPYGDYKYDHNTSNFEIYNAGKELDPRSINIEFKITINANASEYIELINKTTKDVYRYDGSLTTSDDLVISGIRSLKNGLSVFRDTNKKIIKLSHGVNQFEVKGTSNIDKILFDFKFYY